MNKIFYLEDETGQKQVINIIKIITIKALEDDGYAELAKYIAKALDYLESVGVPDDKFLPFVTEREDGRLITFATIVKKLNHFPPLLEFRVNWRGTGYFRAIFFCINRENGQSLYFTKAILKQESNPPEFNLLAEESLKMLEEFISNTERD